MKIWITGASGSLGMSLLETLENQVSAQILAPPRSELDLEDKEKVLNFVLKNVPTHIFHLAATVYGISGHQENPEESLLINTRIDNSVFSALFKSPPKWIYYSSTVAAYGHPYFQLPLLERDFLKGNPHSSEFGYAMSKRFSLNYLETMKRKHQTKFVYGLSTNLFGVGDRFHEGRGHVVISLLEKAIHASRKGLPLEVWGDGLASRDLLSTQDAAKIIVSLIGKDVGIVNIASGQEIRISEIAELIVREFEISSGYRFIGENEGIINRYCSTKKLESFLESPLTINSRSRLSEEISVFRKLLSDRYPE